MFKNNLREPFFDKEDGGSGSTDGSKNTDNSDENKKTGITQEDVNKAVQAAVNNVTAKYKKQIETLGTETEELRKFKTEKEEEAEKLENESLEKKAEFDKIREKMLENHNEEKTKLNNKIKSQESDIRRLVVDAHLAKLAPELKVIPEAISDFIEVVSKNIGFEKIEDNGTTTYKVYPVSEGVQMMNPKTGEAMTTKDYLDDFLDIKPHFRQPLVGAGSGGKGSSHHDKNTPSTSREAIHIGYQKLKEGKK